MTACCSPIMYHCLSLADFNDTAINVRELSPDLGPCSGLIMYLIFVLTIPFFMDTTKKKTFRMPPDSKHLVM